VRSIIEIRLVNLTTNINNAVVSVLFPNLTTGWLKDDLVKTST